VEKSLDAVQRWNQVETLRSSELIRTSAVVATLCIIMPSFLAGNEVQ